MRRMKGGTKDGWRRDVGGMKEGLSERLMEEGGMKRRRWRREEERRNTGGGGVGGSGFDWLIEKKKREGKKRTKLQKRNQSVVRSERLIDSRSKSITKPIRVSEGRSQAACFRPSERGK